MNFDNIDYLKNGNTRQRQAYVALSENQILSKLQSYDPILVGTIPINIDIENSDLDIICCFADKQDFIKTITDNFSREQKFTLSEQQHSGTLAIVANFFVGNFELEIFGQTIPSKQQFAYRHLIIEHQLLAQYGEKFRQQIIALKRKGYKTEPAFGVALDLKGDPYMELLQFETKGKSLNR